MESRKNINFFNTKCKTTYTAQNFESRCKKRDICLAQPEKSAVNEYTSEMGCTINFSNTSSPDKTPEYMGHLKKEAIKIRVHPKIFNRDGGFNFSQSWYPLNDKAVSKNTNLETIPSLVNL
jgi:hypothetical protein